MAKAQSGPAIGAERYLVEMLSYKTACAAARKNGWDGKAEGLLDHCDAGQAGALRTEHRTFDAAVAVARAFEQSGDSLFGASLVEHERFEEAHDDRGRRVEGGSWERVALWEVTREGEPLQVDE